MPCPARHSTPFTSPWHWLAVCTLTALLLLPCLASAAPRNSTLPAEVETALAQAKVPRDAVAFLVVDAQVT